MMRKQLAFLAALTILLAPSITGTEPAAITGEIVDTYCWAKMRIGGPAHAACGIECAKRGVPVAILDSRTGIAYVLLPGRDKRSVPAELVAAMGRSVTARGEIVTRGGNHFLSVQSWTPVRATK
jgi:hypothetical protein